MDRLTQDLRVALRSLRRAPAFVLTAIAILALGIGTAAAMFTISHAVLGQALPVRDQDRVVLPRALDARGTDISLTDLEFDDFRHRTHTLVGVAAEAHQGAFETALLSGDHPLVLRAAWVTGNFFDLLGARPVLGRLFHTEDESIWSVASPTKSFEPPALVLSYSTWQRQFGGDSTVLGRQFTNPYTRHVYTVIGVAPPGLDYPVGAEYWTPLVYGGGLDLIGRLAPGASVETARQEVTEIIRNRFQSDPNRHLQQFSVAARTLTQMVLGNVRPVIRFLLDAVLLLTLLATVNVGALVLLRVGLRESEIAVRRSLGAGWWDLARQLSTEVFAVVAAGGVAGYGVTRWLIGGLIGLHRVRLPRLDVIGLSRLPGPTAIVLTLAIGAVLAAVALFGALRPERTGAFRFATRSGRGTASRRRVRGILGAAQAALAVAMLAGAGLLVRSLSNLERLHLGYRADHLLLLAFATPVTPGNGDVRYANLLSGLPTALHTVPGVTGVTPIVLGPFYGPQVFNAMWLADGVGGANGVAPRIPIEGGGAEYFSTLGIPILAGRGFLDSDRKGAPRVAVVSQSAAQLLGLGTNPIGRRIRFAGEPDTGESSWRTVVGVAGDIHYRVLREATPTIYLPSAQYFFQGSVAVRSTEPLVAILPALLKAARQVDPSVTIAQAQTVDQSLAEQRALPQLSSLLMSGFAAVALILAILGVYGLMASGVVERTREIGIRMALGASPERVRREILSGALRVTLPGVAAGLLIASLGSRLVTSLLFQISATDPTTLAAASILLVIMGLAAAYLPARRATRIDPAQTLRSE